MRRRIDQPLRLRLLGGLSALSLALAALSACDNGEKKSPTATAERSQAVAATGKSAQPEPAATTKPSATASVAAAKKPPRKLCAGELDKPGRAFPEKTLSRATAPGASEMPAKLKLGGGWTWVNFWAAWCAPCKEEMPRLRAWEKKLAGSGKFNLVFVSLDDDQRQLDDFLKGQPEGGVRASYWLAEGKQREEWLKAAEIEEDPELPTHLLVDPQGKIRCRVKGAVEESDFASVAEIVGK